jgi:hypothetical protein
MVGAESAALSASRMSRERSAGELHSQFEMERVNGIAPSSRPRHGLILPLNHTRKTGVPSRSNLTLRTRPLCALSYGDENWYARPVTLRNPALIQCDAGYKAAGSL